jgi:integrase
MMARKKKWSIKEQVNRTMQHVNSIGTSKREAKEIAEKTGTKTGIHSIKQYQESLKTGIAFAEHAKEKYGIKSIWELTPEMKKSYMEQLANQQGEKGMASNGYKINVETNLQHLQEAMRRVAEMNDKEPVIFMSGRTIKSTEREKPKDRSYSPHELGEIKKHLSDNVRDMTELSVNMGLRRREVANVRVKHVVDCPERGLIIEWKTKEEAKGITKGARPRWIPVPKEYEPKLRELIAGRDGNERISRVKESQLGRNFRKACERVEIDAKGWHSLRHTYARREFGREMGDRMNDPSTKAVMRQMKENIDMGERLDYNIPRNGEMRETYDEILRAADVIHAFLGHGEGRVDLLRVYIL